LVVRDEIPQHGGKAALTSLRGAVLRGLAPDGGLYMPAELARARRKSWKNSSIAVH